MYFKKESERETEKYSSTFRVKPIRPQNDHGNDSSSGLRVSYPFFAANFKG